MIGMRQKETTTDNSVQLSQYEEEEEEHRFQTYLPIDQNIVKKKRKQLEKRKDLNFSRVRLRSILVTLSILN